MWFCVFLSLSFFIFSLSSPSTPITSSNEPKYHVTNFFFKKKETLRHVLYLANINSETIKLRNVTILSGKVTLCNAIIDATSTHARITQSSRLGMSRRNMVFNFQLGLSTSDRNNIWVAEPQSLHHQCLHPQSRFH